MMSFRILWFVSNHHTSNSTLTNWPGTGFFFFFTPTLKGERRKVHLFPLGIQGKNKWIFRGKKGISSQLKDSSFVQK